MDFSFLTASTAIDSGSEDGALISSMPLQNFNFWLLVEGVMSVPLKSVRAFQKVNQYERIKEGGVNDYVTLKRAPIQEPHQLVVERYMMSSLVDPLANGAELTLPIILGIDHASKSWGDSTHAARYYAFTGCTVMSKEYGELNADRSGLATEVITIGYKMMYVVPNLLSIGGDPSKAPTANDLIGDDAVADTINRQLAAQAAEEAQKQKKAEQLKEWANRRAEENESGVVDPTEYGASVKKDKDGNPVLDENGKEQYEWPKKKDAPKESDYFNTDENGNVVKDENGNPVPKGSSAREKAENAAAYAKQKAEAEAYNADLDKQQAAYKEACDNVQKNNEEADGKVNAQTRAMADRAGRNESKQIQENKNNETRRAAQEKAKERRADENKGDIKAENYEDGEESADYKSQQAYQESQQKEADRRSDEQTERKNQEAENTKAYENAQQDEANRRTGEQAGRKSRETRDAESYNRNQQDEANRRTGEQAGRKSRETRETESYNRNQKEETERRAQEQKDRKAQETKDNEEYKKTRGMGNKTDNKK